MKKRLISAAIMLAIVIPLFIIGGKPFAVGVGFIGLLAFKEIVDLMEKDKKLPTIIKFIGAIAVLLMMYMSFDVHSIELGLSYKAVVLLMLGLLIPTLFLGKGKITYTTKEAFYLVGFVLLIGVVFNAFILVMNISNLVFLYLILITTMTDTFAYVLGSLLGKNKLMPSVSPNKSWEGSILGSLMGTFIASFYYINVINGDIFIGKIVIITLLLSIIGQLGDLLFSKIKRENEIKDFSKLIPGHGGILDRLDSLGIVVLAFLILVSYL